MISNNIVTISTILDINCPVLSIIRGSFAELVTWEHEDFSLSHSSARRRLLLCTCIYIVISIRAVYVGMSFIEMLSSGGGSVMRGSTVHWPAYRMSIVF